MQMTRTPEGDKRMAPGINTLQTGLSLSDHTVDKANKAKITLQTYYSNLIEQHLDRQNR